MSSREEQNFLNLLKQIAARPAMYVGIAKIRLITTLILGLSWGHDVGKRGSAFTSIGGGNLVNGFWSWAMTQFDVPYRHPAWGLDRILLHNYDHDHVKAIAAIPVLYEQWLDAKDEWISQTIEQQDTEEKQRIIDTYGKDYGAPECVECDGWQLD